MSVYKKFVHPDGRYVEIWYDEYSESPREWNPLGTIAYKHSHYTLGEEKITELVDFLAEKIGMDEDALIRFSDRNKCGIYSGKTVLELKHRFENHKDFIVLPVYLFDHSGQSISTTPFSCQWDSCQIGFIYARREAILKEYPNAKIMTKKIKEAIKERLKAEIAIFNEYIEGNCYGFTVYSKDGNNLDSCGGFIGTGDNLIADMKCNISNEHHEIFNYEANK